jgi:hypothetical protein
METRCNRFAFSGKGDPDWALNCVIRFLQFQKERVEREEITGATLRNFVKSIKLFCEMSDIPLSWKKITRGLPKIRRHADDRAPTIEEIRRIVEYPDRRIKAIVYTMASSGIRLGAWDYLLWKHVTPVHRNGVIAAAKLTVYAGDDEEYVSFITPEAYYELEKWMNFRRDSGESINENSCLLRQLWDTKKGYYHHGTVKAPIMLKSSGIKRLMEDALWTQGIRKKEDLKRNRYEFQTDHGFRKWFKTRCELSGIRSINIEKLMGHSIGISDSYYKITEAEILNDYLKAIDFLTISNVFKLKKEIEVVKAKQIEKDRRIMMEIYKKDQEKNLLKTNDLSNSDAIAALAEQVINLTKQLESLKVKRRANKKLG